MTAMGQLWDVAGRNANVLNWPTRLGKRTEPRQTRYFGLPLNPASVRSASPSMR